jgi:hypothetical protein
MMWLPAGECISDWLEGMKMANIPVKIVSPQEYAGAGEAGPFPIEQYPKRCLAQGDSWFSFGAIPPFLTTNLLDDLELSFGTCIVNCATPGAKLRRMADTLTNATFVRLLNGASAIRWDAILLSGGGNDLIEAIQSTDPDPAKRILAVQAEWRDNTHTPGARYISEAGWSTFSDHLTAVFKVFVEARDAGVNRDVPVVFHTYDEAAPRNAPAGLSFGPWLYKAVTAFGIPQTDWDNVTQEVFRRLRALLAVIAASFKGGIVIDTVGKLTLAGNGTPGPTADWQNEIHPTRGGYRKMNVVWQPVLDQLLG